MYTPVQAFLEPLLRIDDIHCGQYHLPLGGASIPTHG